MENFAEIRKEDFYYVDKTKFIEELLVKWGEANIFTRPRRFGKSLNMSMLRNFFEIGNDPSLFDGKPEAVEQLFTAYMKKTISVRDTSVRKSAKENFYHGILLGILGFKDGWMVTSNKEAGDGFSDITVRIDDSEIGIVIEIKYAEDGNMEAECRKALEQMQKKHYTEVFDDTDVHHILRYGIACNRKNCRVLLTKSEC